MLCFSPKANKARMSIPFFRPLRHLDDREQLDINHPCVCLIKDSGELIVRKDMGPAKFPGYWFLLTSWLGWKQSCLAGGGRPGDPGAIATIPLA